MSKHASPSATLAERLALHSRRRKNGCLEWVGSKKETGYGRLRFKGKQQPVHRLAYVAAHGAIPDGLHVLHKCHNRACIEPSHLKLGTHQDNMDDMYWAKRRTPARGEEHGNAALTDDQAAAIRLDPRIAREVAADYGVHISTIYKIRQWRSYSGG